MFALKALDRGAQLDALVARCRESAQAAVACAEACEASGLTDTFRDCVQACTDCAAICSTMALVASRHTGGGKRALPALLRACADACGECARECANHNIEAARRCAWACMQCKQTCERLGQTMRWR